MTIERSEIIVLM